MHVALPVPVLRQPSSGRPGTPDRRPGRPPAATRARPLVAAGDLPRPSGPRARHEPTRPSTVTSAGHDLPGGVVVGRERRKTPRALWSTHPVQCEGRQQVGYDARDHIRACGQHLQDRPSASAPLPDRPTPTVHPTTPGHLVVERLIGWRRIGDQDGEQSVPAAGGSARTAARAVSCAGAVPSAAPTPFWWRLRRRRAAAGPSRPRVTSDPPDTTSASPATMSPAAATIPEAKSSAIDADASTKDEPGGRAFSATWSTLSAPRAATRAASASGEAESGRVSHVVTVTVATPGQCSPTLMKPSPDTSRGVSWATSAS